MRKVRTFVIVALIFAISTMFYFAISGKEELSEVLIIDNLYDDISKLISIQEDIIQSALNEEDVSSLTLYTSLNHLTELQRDAIHNFVTLWIQQEQPNELITELYTFVSVQKDIFSEKSFNQLETHDFENIRVYYNLFRSSFFDIVATYSDPSDRIDRYLYHLREINLKLQEKKL